MTGKKETSEESKTSTQCDSCWMCVFSVNRKECDSNVGFPLLRGAMAQRLCGLWLPWDLRLCLLIELWTDTHSLPSRDNLTMQFYHNVYNKQWAHLLVLTLTIHYLFLSSQLKWHSAHRSYHICRSQLLCSYSRSYSTTLILLCTVHTHVKDTFPNVLIYSSILGY